MSPNLSGIFSLYLEGVLNNITIGIKFLGGSKTFISNLWGGVHSISVKFIGRY